MKKLYFLVLLSVIYDWNVNAQSPAWQWARTAGGASNDYGINIATDVSGNVLATGYFQSDTITFGSVTLINGGTGNFDIFIVKYDSSGNVLWAKSAGGNAADESTGICTDASENVIVTGFFYSDSITFGTTTLMNTSADGDIFIVKYDASGNVLWAKSAGGTDQDVSAGITSDVGGNILVTGSFSSDSISFGTTTLFNLNGGNGDMYIVSYDASGIVNWAKSAGGIDPDGSKGISTDASGKIMVTGIFFSDSITFDTIVLINPNAGVADIFIVKYNTSGNVIWAKSQGGTDFDCSNGIASDGSGNIFVTGFFASDSITFDTTTLINTSANWEIFIAKYDASGNILWAKSAGGTDQDASLGVTTDGNGNVLITGFFSGDSATFGTTTLINTNVLYSDIFVVKYGASGNVLWAKSVEGSESESGWSISSDYSGNILVTGYYGCPFIIFGSDTLIMAGAYDAFIAKLDGASATGIEEATEISIVTNIYPNPSDGKFKIACSENINEIKITNLTGQIIYQAKPNKNNISLQLDVAGIYFIQATIKDQIVNKKIIVNR